MKVKQLKEGELFTKKQIADPSDDQVWIRGNYIRTEKKYECINFDDANRYCYLPADKEVFTDFIF